MPRFDEAALEQVIVERLAQNGFSYVFGGNVEKDFADVLLRADLIAYLTAAYPQLTEAERARFIKTLDNFSAGALYESNRAIMRMVADGYLFHRDNPTDKDVLIRLVNYDDKSKNIFKVVNQFEIKGPKDTRIPDVVLFVNGLPLVVFELKTPVKEEVTIEDAYNQLTVRYRRDIPELFKYNAFVVISDGVNTKAGSVFAKMNNFYAWRTKGDGAEKDGIGALYTMLDGLFNPDTFLAVLHDFIYFPDDSKKEEKIVCRYPQFYAVQKLYDNILRHVDIGDGKGGTYFGATGCGKSFTMLYLTRRLMRSPALNSPTIVVISDRVDLDDQLSGQFIRAKKFFGDECVESVANRADLAEKLQGRQSGGVFLTTIQKFSEDVALLSDRRNIICISDEAHRSQVNLDQKLKVADGNVERKYGFAHYLRQSLPNATYVGFTGTPIDATLDVFGDIVDAYTMTQAVDDGITVRIVYEGRAAKITTDNEKLTLIEQYYEECEQAGANEYQIEESKKKNATVKSVIGHPDRLKAVAADFVAHYESRVAEKASVLGKAMFVCADREIAYALYKEIIALRPDWAVAKECDDGAVLTEADKRELRPIEKIKLVMTYNKDDEPDLYNLLCQDDKEELARQFKNDNSNFKIAVVVDMWLTGFDVPSLDTMYLDKYVHKHTLIQTISRVNRVYAGKEKGLVVDYIGIQRALSEAVKQYGFGGAEGEPQDTSDSVAFVKDQLDVLSKMLYTFDDKRFFAGNKAERLDCLNDAAEFVMQTDEFESRFMWHVKRLKSAYNMCVTSSDISNAERDKIHFYLAVRSIVCKMTKGDAPDVAQMNERVRQLVCDALISSKVEDIFKLQEKNASVDLFSEEYLAHIAALKHPNTRVQILERLLKNAIFHFKEVNKIKAVEFSEKLKSIVEKYNNRTDKVDLKQIAGELIDLIYEMQAEKQSFVALGIDFEEKAFYDILKTCATKYGFTYPEDKMIFLAKEIKRLVGDKAKYTNFLKKQNIRAALQMDLIVLMDENGYPPEPQEEVYQDVIEQAENFKKYQAD